MRISQEGIRLSKLCEPSPQRRFSADGVELKNVFLFVLGHNDALIGCSPVACRINATASNLRNGEFASAIRRFKS